MRGGLYREADPVARGGAPGPPVARRRGDRPPWRAHWPVAPGGATGPLFFFLQGLRCKFEEKKITFEPCHPP